MIGVSRNRKSPHDAVAGRIRRHAMAGIDVLASFGIGAAELDAYERADPPRPARGSLGRRAKDRAAKSCRLRSQAGICGPCIDAPGLGKLGNSLPEGFNDKAKTLEKAVAAYPTSSASGSGYSSSSTKTTPGNEGDSKNRHTPGKVGEPLKFCGDDNYCNNLYLDEIPFL